MNAAIFILSFLFSSYAIGLTGTASFKGSTLNGLIKFDGKGIAISGGDYTPSGIEGTFKADLSKLETGDHDRDKDAHKDYLETTKFPEATLVLEPTKGPVWRGNLTFHGVSKPVTGKLEIKGKKATFTFDIKYEDYNVKRPSLAGIKLIDRIPVVVDIDLP